MQQRPTALTIGLIIRSFIALFYVYTKFGIDSLCFPKRKKQRTEILQSLLSFFFSYYYYCLIQFNSFYYLNSSCNKIVNKYAQPLHVYRLLQCFLSQFILSSCNKSSCNKLVNKYVQPLHVYCLLSAVLFFILCFLFLFVLFSCSVCIIPRLCDSFNR